MKIMNKKPTRETETMRIYAGNGYTKKELAEINKGSFEIEYNGEKLKMVGFNKGMDKDGKVVFAFKVKMEAGHILYYIPEGVSIEDRGLFLRSLNELIEYSPIKLELIDVVKMLPIIASETNLMDKSKKNGGNNGN
jgi:hypothetical protein